MKISELLKEYRIKQGKTQKEWSGNVLSTSFYTKVEKNRCRIYAQDLIDLLRENNISPVDFFDNLDPKERHIRQQEEKINSEIDYAYYKNSLNDLRKIRESVAKTNLPDKEDKLLTIDAFTTLIENDPSKFDPKVVTKVKERIFNTVNFCEKDMILYCDFMIFYDLSSNLIISKRILKQFAGNNHIRIQKIILGIIINILVPCICEKRFIEAKFYVNYAQQIKTKPDTFFYKSIILALKNIIEYHSNHQQKNLIISKQIFDSISIAGMPDYAKDLREVLDMNKQ